VRKTNNTFAESGRRWPIPHIAFIECSKSEAGKKKFGISGCPASDLVHSVKDNIQMKK